MSEIRCRVASEGNPFDLAVALETVTTDSDRQIGETFVLVANRTPFLGFQRQAADVGSREAVGGLTARVFEKMVRAAMRRGRAPSGCDPERTAFCEAPFDETLAGLWGRGMFEAHLRWIAGNTASSTLRKVILDFVESAARDDGHGTRSES